MFLKDIYTEIFAEAVWDKIFAVEIIAALGRAVSDTISDAGYSAINFFTVAVTQGTLRIFRVVFILKYLQRGFGTRFLIMRSLPHLDVL